MNKKQLELINYALTIMKKRAISEHRNAFSKCAYNSAVCMCLYALQENEEALRQFDYD